MHHYGFNCNIRVSECISYMYFTTYIYILTEIHPLYTHTYTHIYTRAHTIYVFLNKVIMTIVIYGIIDL